jgi:O-antigen/teichoic acid export membrane protein
MASPPDAAERVEEVLPSADVTRAELKEKTFKSLRWATLARIAAEVTAVGSAVVLAHLIPPDEFGRVAVAMIIGDLALSLANEGVGSALVRRRDLERAHVESAQLLSLAVGATLTLFTLLVVPLVSTPLFGEQTTELVRLYTPMFLIAAIAIVPLAMLERQLDFRRISIIEIASVQVTVASSIVYALLGLDAEAYVLGTVTGFATWALLLVIFGPNAWPRWHRRQMSEVAGFGLRAGLAGSAQVSYGNIDFLVAGGTLSAAAVGFYYRAYALGVQYQNKISAIITRIVYPVYSRTEDLDHMRELRSRVMRVNATVIFPLLALFVAVAPMVVPWLFGEQWEPAVVPAQILTIAGMARMINNNTPAVMLAAGRPRTLLYFNLYRVGTLGVMVLIASRWGLTGVCVAVAAFQVMTLFGSYRFVLSRMVGVTVRQLLLDTAPAVVASAAMLVLAYPLAAGLDAAGLPVLLLVAAVGLVCTPVYLVTLRLTSRPAWDDAVLIVHRILIPARFHKAAPTAVSPAGT